MVLIISWYTGGVRLSAERLSRQFVSSGRIRTYDQSVNPDSVGTLPLSYAFVLTSRSRIKRAEFQFLIRARVALRLSDLDVLQTTPKPTARFCG